MTLDPDSTCNQLFPFHENPRIVAGGPRSHDVLKCELASQDRVSYPVTFTDDQWNRLQNVFPDGVCDWSQPGVGQVPLADTWLRFRSPAHRTIADEMKDEVSARAGHRLH